MSKQKINIDDKELERDIVNLHLPEIDWEDDSYKKKYPKEFLDKHGINNKKKTDK